MEPQQPTQPITPVEPLHQIKPKLDIFDLILKVLGIFVLFAIIVAMAFLSYLYVKTKENQDLYLTSTTTPTPTKEAPQQALVSGIPNFENLAMTDLFAQDDIRGVFNYNEKIIVVGYGKVLEWDPSIGQLSRIGTAPIDCAYSGTVVLDSLYIACQSIEFGGAATIYEIDLQTGLVVDRQTGMDGLNLVNPRLYYDNKSLWIGSWDGALRIDPKTKVKKLFKPENFIPNCNKGNIDYFLDDFVMNAGCASDTSAIWRFNYETETWDKDSTITYNFSRYFNNTLKEYDLRIPRFFAYSKIIDGKRYLLADIGVYTLSKGHFPQKLIELDLNKYSFPGSGTIFSELDSELRKSFYMTKDSKWGVLIRGIGDGMDPVDNVAVLLIDVENKAATDLLADFTYEQKSEFYKIFASGTTFDSLYWTQTPTTIEAFQNSKKFINIDLEAKTVEITSPIPLNL